jgi:hypothetical protein
MIGRIRAVLPVPFDLPNEPNSETLESNQADKGISSLALALAKVPADDSPLLDTCRRPPFVCPILAPLLSADGVG